MHGLRTRKTLPGAGRGKKEKEMLNFIIGMVSRYCLVWNHCLRLHGVERMLIEAATTPGAAFLGSFLSASSMLGLLVSDDMERIAYCFLLEGWRNTTW